MKTDEFIAALAEDNRPAVPPRRALPLAVAAAVFAACAVFFVVLGPRPDFLHALASLRFVFKFVVSATLAVAAYVSLRAVLRPEARRPPLRYVLLTAPALLLIAVALELAAVPSAAWAARWIGQNWLQCMVFIPVLSLAPFGILLAVLREGASTNPARTGALAGLLAAGIGALFYAAHCPDDSPLFVASWYTIAVLFMAGLGAAAGARWLRW